MNSHANIIPVLSASTLERLNAYLKNIKEKSFADDDLAKLVEQKVIGRRLYEVLKNSNMHYVRVPQLVDALLKTTMPVAFAESTEMVKGDGADWTLEEISLLGRIARVVNDVTVYSKSTYNPSADDLFDAEDELPATTLLFTNGALLAGCGADRERVLDEDGSFNQHKYDQFLEENLLPSLVYASHHAGETGAVVTMPVLGGGQFAGNHAKEITANFPEAIERLIEKHHEKLTNIKAVIITGVGPYKYIASIPIRMTKTPVGLYPAQFDASYHAFKTYTCVAADHVSFPGNDGYTLSCTTHEGGTCTRTNVYTHITGVKGRMKGSIYMPQGVRNWQTVCEDNKTTLHFSSMQVQNDDGLQEIEFKENAGYKPCYLNPPQSEDDVLDTDEAHPLELEQPEKKSFLARQPWLKYAALGFVIGLAVVALIALLCLNPVIAGGILTAGGAVGAVCWTAVGSTVAAAAAPAATAVGLTVIGSAIVAAATVITPGICALISYSREKYAKYKERVADRLESDEDARIKRFREFAGNYNGNFAAFKNVDDIDLTGFVLSETESIEPVAPSDFGEKDVSGTFAMYQEKPEDDLAPVEEKSRRYTL
jgi:hypothetical protein